MKESKIGDFLKRSKIPIDILDSEIYNRVTIRINHNGVSLRDTEIGKNIGTKKQFVLKSGQFIVSKIDARYGAFGIAPAEVDNSIITGNFWAYDVDKEKVSIEWFNQFTNSPIFYELCERASSGITHRKYLDERFFLEYKIYLPSVEEQLKQIKKINLQKESFQSLSTELTHQLALVKKLRQQLLQDAVQGKLLSAPGFSNDFNDSEYHNNQKNQSADSEHSGHQLLQRIKAEKAALRKAQGDKKKEKELAPIKPEEIPFDIPENWVWCRLGEICNKIGSGSTPKGSNYSENGIPFFRSQNIYDTGLILEDISYITDEVHNQMKGTIVYANDILLNITGGSMGRCALVPKSFFQGNVSQHVCIIRPTRMSNEFCHKIFLTPYFQNLIFSSTTGAGREGLPKYNLEQFPIPLPPLCEQTRIVEKLDELIKYCDELEASIKESQAQNEKLLQQVLREALQPGIYISDSSQLSIAAEPSTEYKRENSSQKTQRKINWNALNDSPYSNNTFNAENNKINDINWELALMVACMDTKLGVTYGDVGLQKNFFNTNTIHPIFSKQYDFVNHNFGTFSSELKDDFKRNPYLVKKVEKNKEVYIINPVYKKQVLDKLTSPENREFVQAINYVLSIYENRFINKETDKIELFNTVLKLAMDLKTKDLNVIYNGMKEWVINQEKYKTKAEKFNIEDVKKILDMINGRKII